MALRVSAAMTSLRFFVSRVMASSGTSLPFTRTVCTVRFLRSASRDRSGTVPASMPDAARNSAFTWNEVRAPTVTALPSALSRHTMSTVGATKAGGR